MFSASLQAQRAWWAALAMSHGVEMRNWSGARQIVS